LKELSPGYPGTHTVIEKRRKNTKIYELSFSLKMDAGASQPIRIQMGFTLIYSPASWPIQEKNKCE
jgi:hypothetical protein